VRTGPIVFVVVGARGPETELQGIADPVRCGVVHRHRNGAMRIADAGHRFCRTSAPEARDGATRGETRSLLRKRKEMQSR